jgi:uncharacterized protein YdeI (YjbR/CyaY-like superfamily)
MPQQTDPRVDAYIEKSAPFAQPILRHLRGLVHQSCPDVVEAIKWTMPHFLNADRILCSMAAFKAHAAFGFCHRELEQEIGRDIGHVGKAAGLFGRITSLRDLPADRKMIRYIKRAAELNASGAPVRPKSKPKPEAKVPADLAAALKRNKKAAAAFTAFSPSHRREYIEWITEAKRDETRQKRLATTLEWLAAGQPRNWKYMNC